MFKFQFVFHPHYIFFVREFQQVCWKTLKPQKKKKRKKERKKKRKERKRKKKKKEKSKYWMVVRLCSPSTTDSLQWRHEEFQLPKDTGPRLHVKIFG